MAITRIFRVRIVPELREKFEEKFSSASVHVVNEAVPLEAIAILFAVDTIPDMVETASNVTADMTATTIVNHHAGEMKNLAGEMSSA
jgi:Na+/H+-dicarboxylate symporter